MNVAVLLARTGAAPGTRCGQAAPLHSQVFAYASTIRDDSYSVRKMGGENQPVTFAFIDFLGACHGGNHFPAQERVSIETDASHAAMPRPLLRDHSQHSAIGNRNQPCSHPESIAAL